MADKDTKNTSTEEKNKSDVSPRRSSYRSKKWLKWLILLLVFGGIIGLIWYFSTSHYIVLRNVESINFTDGAKQSIKLTTKNDKEYKTTEVDNWIRRW